MSTNRDERDSFRECFFLELLAFLSKIICSFHGNRLFIAKFWFQLKISSLFRYFFSCHFRYFALWRYLTESLFSIRTLFKKKLLHQSFGAFDKFAGGKNVQDMNSIWINCGQNGKKTRKREMQYQTLVSTFLTIQNLNINRKFGKDQTKREWKKNQDSALSKLKWEPSMN